MTTQDALRIAANIANPWSEESPPDLTAQEAEKMAALLAWNHASLLPLARRCRSELDASLLLPYVKQEELLFKRLRAEFERVNLEFENKAIRTVFIKSTGLYPSFPHLSSNLDVMVPRERGDEARKTLRELGYIELINAEEPKKFLFRRFVANESSFTFHLHEQVGWGVPFVDSKAVWQNARPAPDDAGVCIPGPVEALLITLAHWFYEDKALSLGNVFVTGNAIRNLPCPLDEAAKGASVRGWQAGFHAALKIFNQSWQHLFGVYFLNEAVMSELDEHLEKERFIRSAILSKARYLQKMPATVPFGANKIIYYRKIIGDTRRSPGQRIKDVFLTLVWAFHLKAHVRSQKPFLIAASGCDGSGKTVHVNYLAEAFQTCGLRTRVIWSRGGSSGLMSMFIRAAKKLISQRAKNESMPGTRGPGPAKEAGENAKVMSRRKNLQNPFLRFLYSVLYSIDLSLVYCIKTRIHLWLGNAVICDRYLADAQVDFAMTSGQPVDKPPLAMKLLRWFAPRPNLSYVLDVEETEALRRKPEEGSSEHLAEARAMFLRAAKRHDMTIIAAGASKEAIMERIVYDCLDSYYKRRGTLVNGLLFMNPNQLNPGRWRD
ncbi:MAG: hypothetical protein ABIA59_01590 [Candidatus Latescibacterota bacterium]